MKKISLLLLAMVGIGLGLLCSCAGTKPATLGSSNPAYYNPDSREFESRWPFGPAGFR